jgi:hypothetical protein
MLSTSAATEPTVSGETSTYVNGHLAVPRDELAIAGKYRSNYWERSATRRPPSISAETACSTKIVFWQANWAR